MHKYPLLAYNDEGVLISKYGFKKPKSALYHCWSNITLDLSCIFSAFPILFRILFDQFVIKYIWINYLLL